MVKEVLVNQMVKEVLRDQLVIGLSSDDGKKAVYLSLSCSSRREALMGPMAWLVKDKEDMRKSPWVLVGEGDPWNLRHMEEDEVNEVATGFCW
ncbi:hypothetical protein M5K25_024009 [Dendrobium thyrsiflorum]|uniref:Uncharacterized protein n=1 Tax=Dendrobium thyrsiflorum TaxID=117978 RepID=A0ABD0U171_DENTH